MYIYLYLQNADFFLSFRLNVFEDVSWIQQFWINLGWSYITLLKIKAIYYKGADTNFTVPFKNMQILKVKSQLAVIILFSQILLRYHTWQTTKISADSDLDACGFVEWTFLNSCWNTHSSGW